MKRKILLFIYISLLALAIPPIINMKIVIKQEDSKKWSKDTLYNIDFALPYVNKWFYALGISIIPDQVIVGKEGWLYLGDQYENIITLRRNGATTQEIEAAPKIATAMLSWQQWLKKKGVDDFRIIIVPNKESLYPEFLPDWAHSNADSATNVLLNNVSNQIYIDTRPAFLQAKKQFSERLYYKTDSHWNGLGAWVAFSAFAKAVAPTQPNLRWPKARISLQVDERQGGDLASLLHMQNILPDSEILIEVDSKLPVETAQYDFETQKLKRAGGNPPIYLTHGMLLVKSPNALNNKKVLWLRDSFGTIFSPYMAATFSETLQFNYGEVIPNQFSKLITRYKPDYIFVTVVERQAYHKWFESFPPNDNSDIEK